MKKQRNQNNNFFRDFFDRYSIQQIVKKLGGDIDYNFVGEIALEIAEKVAGYQDANHQQISDQGVLINSLSVDQ